MKTKLHSGSYKKRSYFILATFAFGLLSSHQTAQSAEYKLGPQDKLRIKVYEWRAARGDTYEWTPFTGDFTVNPSGLLSLPLIGELQATGLSLKELTEHVSDSLQARLGLAERPIASVEVLIYRPFYVLGDVEKSGEYPYRPELSVFQAVSIAGGFVKRIDATAEQYEHQSITSRGDLRVLNAEYLASLARRARLMAEIDRLPAIQFPDELTKAGQSAAINQLLDQERLIFEARENGFKTKVENLKQARISLENELATLREKNTAQEKQIEMAKKERSNVNSLAEKGLALSSRSLSMEQTVAQLEGARLDVGLLLMRAEQDRSKLSRDLLDLTDQRRTEVALELRLVDSKIAELNEKIKTSQILANRADIRGQQEFEMQDRPTLTDKLKFTILRGPPNETVELAADGNTGLEPGDVLRVERRLTFSNERANFDMQNSIR